MKKDGQEEETRLGREREIIIARKTERGGGSEAKGGRGVGGYFTAD